MNVRFDPVRLSALRARMAHHLGTGRHSAISWRIATLQGVIDEGHLGTASDRTLWRIYSMTKPLVSVAALQLVETCHVPLHAPVSRWLPEFADMRVLAPSGGTEPARRPITVLHLLSHMAGLSYGFLADAAARRYAEAGVLADDTRTLRDEARLIASLPLAGHPGEGWRYSVATDVLAAVLEVVENRPIGEILHARVFQPLQMAQTGFSVPAGSRDRIAPIHGTPLPPHVPAVPPLGIDAVYPDDLADFARGGHGLFSTVEDYSRFARALLAIATGAGDGLLAPRSLAAMTENQVPGHALPLRIDLPWPGTTPGLGGIGFGMGFGVDLGARGRPLLGQAECFGWSGAADTWFTVDPTAGFFAVFMAQDLDQTGASADFQTMLHASVQ